MAYTRGNDESEAARLESRLRWLCAIEPGWYDGDGEAPTEPAMAWLRAFLVEIGASVAYPHLFPTFDGGVTAEAQPGARRWSLEVEPDGSPSIACAGGSEPPTCIEPSDAAEAARSFELFAREQTSPAL